MRLDLESTPSGMNTLHGTATAVYQSESDHSSKATVVIDRSSKSYKSEDTTTCEILPCAKPEPRAEKCSCQLTSNELSAEAAKKRDLAWVIGCLSFKEN